MTTKKTLKKRTGRPKGDRITEPLNLRIEADVKRHLESKAKELDRTVSWLVSQAINQYLA